MRRAGMLCVLLLGSVACTGTGTDTDTDTDSPLPVNARFVADAYLQDCRWSGDDWLGVEALAVTLHHASDALEPIELPAPGTCVGGLQLFAEEALPTGAPIPGTSGAPRYTSPEAEGSLREVLPGLWHSDAFSQKDRCGTLEEAIGEGVVLEQAGVFSDLQTPGHAAFEAASIDGARFVDRGPLATGETLTLTWDASGWDAAFVQIRRENERGEALDVITCGADGGRFTLDEAAWDQANDAVITETNRLYLGLVREQRVETVDGSSQAWMLVRALHVLSP